jgi:hypothetical protein
VRRVRFRAGARWAAFRQLGGDAMYIGIGTILVILLILILIGVLR